MGSNKIESIDVYNTTSILIYQVKFHVDVIKGPTRGLRLIKRSPVVRYPYKRRLTNV